jgi:hypothetical protein
MSLTDEMARSDIRNQFGLASSTRPDDRFKQRRRDVDDGRSCCGDRDCLLEISNAANFKARSRSGQTDESGGTQGRGRSRATSPAAISEHRSASRLHHASPRRRNERGLSVWPWPSNKRSLKVDAVIAQESATHAELLKVVSELETLVARLNSLPEVRAARGARGARGLQGERGERGQRGQRGEQGLRGEKGDTP